MWLLYLGGAVVRGAATDRSYASGGSLCDLARTRGAGGVSGRTYVRSSYRTNEEPLPEQRVRIAAVAKAARDRGERLRGIKGPG